MRVARVVLVAGDKESVLLAFSVGLALGGSDVPSRGAGLARHDGVGSLAGLPLLALALAEGLADAHEEDDGGGEHDEEEQEHKHAGLGVVRQRAHSAVERAGGKVRAVQAHPGVAARGGHGAVDAASALAADAVTVAAAGPQRGIHLAGNVGRDGTIGPDRQRAVEGNELAARVGSRLVHQVWHGGGSEGCGDAGHSRGGVVAVGAAALLAQDGAVHILLHADAAAKTAQLVDHHVARHAGDVVAELTRAAVTVAEALHAARVGQAPGGVRHQEAVGEPVNVAVGREGRRAGLRRVALVARHAVRVGVALALEAGDAGPLDLGRHAKRGGGGRRGGARPRAAEEDVDAAGGQAGVEELEAGQRGRRARAHGVAPGDGAQGVVHEDHSARDRVVVPEGGAERTAVGGDLVHASCPDHAQQRGQVTVLVGVDAVAGHARHREAGCPPLGRHGQLEQLVGQLGAVVVRGDLLSIEGDVSGCARGQSHGLGEGVGRAAHVHGEEGAGGPGDVNTDVGAAGGVVQRDAELGVEEPGGGAAGVGRVDDGREADVALHDVGAEAGVVRALEVRLGTRRDRVEPDAVRSLGRHDQVLHQTGVDARAVAHGSAEHAAAEASEGDELVGACLAEAVPDGGVRVRCQVARSLVKHLDCDDVLDVGGLARVGREFDHVAPRRVGERGRIEVGSKGAGEARAGAGQKLGGGCAGEGEGEPRCGGTPVMGAAWPPPALPQASKLPPRLGNGARRTHRECWSSGPAVRCSDSWRRSSPRPCHCPGWSRTRTRRTGRA